MIQTIPILPGVELQTFPDKRFKQGCLSIQLIRPMCENEAAMNALIPSVLLRGTKKHPDLRSVTMVMDDLYGAAIGPLVRRVGDYQTTGLYCGFMDPRFALPGDRVLEPVMDFLRELLLESLTSDGGFLPEFVESEKKNLISTIESERNDKQVYAMSRMLRSMCQGDSFGLPRLGEREQVAAIDPVTLYRHYQKILRESFIRIFYVGSADPRQIAELVKPIFDFPDRAPMTLPTQSGLRCGPGGDITETMEVTQGKLCMGFTTPITNRNDDFAATQLLNVVLGGGMTSKLFMNIREKLSLCYDISSGYHGSKGIIAVAAGIDFDKEELVTNKIAEELTACREAKISDEELTSAKEALCSSLRSTHDSPGAIESYYANGALSGLTMTPAEYMDKVLSVTREDVAAAAKTLQLHTVYFLKGVQ